MQTYFEFYPPVAEIKSHCYVYNDCGYVCMKIRKKICGELHLPSEIRSLSLIDPDLTILYSKKKKIERETIRS